MRKSCEAAKFRIVGPAVFFCLAMVVLSASPAPGLEVSRMELLPDRDYTPALITLIESARNSIKVCMFQAIYYPRKQNSPTNKILKALIQAHRRGVTVEVILDNGGSLGKVEETNRQTAQFLKNCGIAVYLDSPRIMTHTKFVTIDAAIAVLGSTNWTYSALARNHELSAIIYSHDAAVKMNEYFERVRSKGQRF